MATTIWIPESLYKLLPLLYAVTGAALIAIFGFNGPSVISATLLLAAAMLTTLWRYLPRKAALKTRASRSVRDAWKKRQQRRTESMPLDGFQ